MNVSVTSCVTDCFERTDWKVFFDECENLNELNDCVTAYISIFVERLRRCMRKKRLNVIHEKNPWVIKELKSYLIKRKFSLLKEIKNIIKTQTKRTQNRSINARRDTNRKSKNY